MWILEKNLLQDIEEDGDKQNAGQRDDHLRQDRQLRELADQGSCDPFDEPHRRSFSAIVVRRPAASSVL